jgi:putative membrane protein
MAFPKWNKNRFPFGSLQHLKFDPNRRAAMSKRRMWKGLLAGGAAGAAGSRAMNQFQNLWTKLSQKQNGKAPQNQSGESTDEDATMKAAGKVAEITGHPLSREQKQKAGPLVHYAFGTGMGALYGALLEAGPRRLRRRNALLTGLGFGSVLFVGADEIVVPALKLSGSPTESPLSSHLYAFASHAVYGITAGAVRKAVRAAL